MFFAVKALCAIVLVAIAYSAFNRLRTPEAVSQTPATVRVVEPEISTALEDGAKADQLPESGDNGDAVVVDPSSATLVVSAAEPVHRTIYNESWIYRQDDRTYTVQLGSSAGKEQLRELGAEFPSGGIFVIYQFKNATGDENEYGIAGGLYNTVAEARDSIAKFTEAQRRYGPWIRSIGELKRLVVNPVGE